METNQGTQARAGRREWIGLGVLALPTLLLSLDMSVLYLALPRLSADLGADATQQLWITDIYGFMIAGFLVTMGTLGDRIGRRKLLLLGAAAFGVASVLAAFAASAEMLIAMRALMGIAGATLMPSTLALISNMFTNPRERGVAIAAWMSSFMAGMAIGPVVGGALLEWFWWGSAFLLGVPVMVLLLVAGPILLPEFRDASQAKRLDFVSVLLSLGAILPVIYGLKELAKHGWQPVPIGALVIGLVLGAVFVRRQRTSDNPLLDVRLFGNRSFSTALTMGLLGGAAMGGLFMFITLYLQMVEGMSPLEAGLWQVPGAVVMIVASMRVPLLARRVRPAYVMAGGFVVMAIAFVMLLQVGAVGGLAMLIAALVVLSIGTGPFALSPDLVVGAAPPEKAGSASAMSETSAEFGIALGVATIGSIGTAIYRDQMAGAVPAEIPAQAADVARESIAGAVATAQHLPPQAAADLLAPAREAFVDGLHTAAGVGTVLVLVLAAVVARVLRHVPPTGVEEPEPDEALDSEDREPCEPEPAAA
ncbi:DHA2 family multidrug resistance protein-like MFS transporter [Herbihabitans rhizosphaerae]|uniref:DHA2 family multidrug resistance protein-like MFS transporter n=2 Tax=Herbihabitans rhizosphaerae TaxID=1872711 RepID=A0A4Q7L2H9_9PSEU|nr:MFS transporter [Herbihabitans rhizosphaerae]RZS43758.1 DHA2 family multidrug resistance protein-like MFS transporter [Herbihabitans rhizosphaerae]